MSKADNLPPSCADVKKSGGLNLLEPCGPVQAYNGTVLPLPFYWALKGLNADHVTLRGRSLL